MFIAVQLKILIL